MCRVQCLHWVRKAWDHNNVSWLRPPQDVVWVKFGVNRIWVSTDVHLLLSKTSTLLYTSGQEVKHLFYSITVLVVGCCSCKKRRKKKRRLNAHQVIWGEKYLVKQKNYNIHRLHAPTSHTHTHTKSFVKQRYKAVKRWQDRTAALTASLSTTLEILAPPVLPSSPVDPHYIFPPTCLTEALHQHRAVQAHFPRDAVFFSHFHFSIFFFSNEHNLILLLLMRAEIPSVVREHS